MEDLKETRQQRGGGTTGHTPEGTEGEHNRGPEFGASERSTRGTDRDLDRSGESKNQGHSHPESNTDLSDKGNPLV